MLADDLAEAKRSLCAETMLRQSRTRSREAIGCSQKRAVLVD